MPKTVISCSEPEGSITIHPSSNEPRRWKAYDDKGAIGWSQISAEDLRRALRNRYQSTLVDISDKAK